VFACSTSYGGRVRAQEILKRTKIRNSQWKIPSNGKFFSNYLENSAKLAKYDIKSREYSLCCIVLCCVLRCVVWCNVVWCCVALC